MLTHQLQGAFEGAYEKAAASSEPEDWMNAAFLGKQFSNAYREESRYPAAYQYLFTSPIGGGDVWRSESSYWNGQRPKASRALFSVPVSRATQAAPNLEGLAKSLLTPREIQRDEDGWLDHPALPVCDENVRFDELLSAFGLETYFRAMDGDVSPEEYDRYYDEQRGCSGWTPTQPDGDGWRLLVIYDTEDGPYAMFARAKQAEPQKRRAAHSARPTEPNWYERNQQLAVFLRLAEAVQADAKTIHDRYPAQSERADQLAAFMKTACKWAALSGQRSGVAEDAPQWETVRDHLAIFLSGATGKPSHT